MDRQRRRDLVLTPSLDRNLAERIISGALTSEDLPPALGPMAERIRALRTDSMGADSTRIDGQAMDSMRAQREQGTIDGMMAAIADSARRPIRRIHLRLPRPVVPSRPLGGFRVRLATSVVAVALAFFMGMAYAGRLPGPAQNAVSVVMSKFGLSVPRHDDQGPNGPAVHGGSVAPTGVAVTPTPSPSGTGDGESGQDEGGGSNDQGSGTDEGGSQGGDNQKESGDGSGGSGDQGTEGQGGSGGGDLSGDGGSDGGSPDGGGSDGGSGTPDGGGDGGSGG